MNKVNALIASTSTLYGGLYLAYLKAEIQALFYNCSELVFIPYARPSGISHEEYTQKVQGFFNELSVKVINLAATKDPVETLQNAKAIFTGGGNTFLLVKQLYDAQLMTVLKNQIENGIPYLGSSAGSNITGLSMGTTNDMPIVLPKSLETLGIVPFNINPHYLDADIQSKHMGETRETRINEFHHINNQPVLGLREGSWLRVKNNQIILEGKLSARWFQKDKTAIEIGIKSNILNYL